MSVFENVVRDCRAALASGMPIIYLLTDSEQLVRQLIDSDRLVMRVLGRRGGISYRLTAGNEHDGFRPHGDAPQEKPVNIIGTLMKREGPFDPNNAAWKTWKYPTLFYSKAELFSGDNPAVGEVNRGRISALEQYVQDHENAADPQYDLLQSSVVLLYSPQVCLPRSLHKYAAFVKVGLPDRTEIESILRTQADCSSIADDVIQTYCTAMMGFGAEEMPMLMRQILNRTLDDDRENPLASQGEVLSIIRRRKENKLQGGLLTLQDTDDSSIGGMDVFKRWIAAQKEVLDRAEEYRTRKGIMPPKGVLLVGIPGCGKSEAAKLTAQTLGYPLLRMDMGSLMGKYVGESEANLASAISLAEAMAPCVLWIDELEKAFGSVSGDNDNAAFKRMFATLLNWMQEKQKPVFLFATANDIGGLPKEFFRSGRFDEKFAVYLPTGEECVDIMVTRMRKLQETVYKRTMDTGAVTVFDEGCFNRDVLRQVVESCLVHDGAPRIVIGSDLAQIINLALASEAKKGYPVRQSGWTAALTRVMNECITYGETAENLDSIALSYCRLLRKGMRPTNGQPMFTAAQYKPAPLDKLMSAQKLDELPPAIREEPRKGLGRYDRAVFQVLKERINRFAPLVEKAEAEGMIRK